MSLINVTNRILNPVKILSTLDNSASLLPLAIKDSVNIAGRTVMAQETGGEHESREKFIEETGTTALWLGGIPLSRWIFDKTIFKAAGLNPDISLKKILDKTQKLTSKELKELTPNANSFILKGADLAKKYKQFHVAKFLFSTLVPFYLLTVTLPKLNQQLSRKIILARALKENKSEKNSESLNLNRIKDNFLKNTAVPINNKQNKTPGFAGVESVLAQIGGKLLNGAAYAQINPVDNMLLLDMGISGNRVALVARNKQERAEYAIKEGGIIFFFFFASKIIKNGFDKLSNKLNIPVDLDFKVLSSKNFLKKMQEIYKNPASKDAALTQFTDLTTKTSEKNAYNFIKKNHKDEKYFALQIAKNLGIIQESSSGILNKAKYIEIKDVEKLSQDIGKFKDAMFKSKLTPEKFINKTKSLKTKFLFANLAICSVALGYVLPKIQYIFREKVYGSKEFPGVKAYKEEADQLLKK